MGIDQKRKNINGYTGEKKGDTGKKRETSAKK